MKSTRRRFLRSATATVAMIPFSRIASAAATKCRPLISGSLWNYNPTESAKWGIGGWSEELDRQAALGFRLLWIGNAQVGVKPESAQLFSAVMDLCAKRGMKVILGVGATPLWYVRLDVKEELANCQDNIRLMAERFARHPAFFAWYIPHEIYMCWGASDTYIQELYPGLVERCKKAAARPVTVSPFFILDRDKIFGDFRFNEPDEYARYWAALIRRAGLDTVMLQDSGEHVSYVTNAMRRPFFQAMQRACRDGGAQLWGNVEVAEFDCPSKDEFVRRYGKIHHSSVKNAPWRPVPLPRLKQKLELASEYCQDIVTWGYQEFCRPPLGETAATWYAAYKQYAAAQRS